MQPDNQTPNFDFIMNENKPQNPGLLTGGSKKRKIIVAGLGISILFLIIFLFFSLLNSGGSSNEEILLSLAQKQTEIIRVSTVGTSKARDSTALDLAVNSSLSVSSLQNDLSTLMSKNGIKTNPKDLALGRDATTDSKLTSAEQSAHFDEVFLEIMKTELKDYQTEIVSANQQTSSTSQKEFFTKAYSQVSLLLGEDSPKN